MHKPSFLAGILAGGGAVVLVGAAVPGIAGHSGTERAPRTTVIVVEERRQPPSVSSAREAEEEPVAPDGQPDAPAAREEHYSVWEDDSPRLSTNEVCAIATLRNIISAQSQFQTTARADESMNGVGEYGSFGEMSGEIGVRDGTVLDPPVLSTAFKRVVHGYVERSGYRFRMYLPGPNGVPVSERSRGGFGAGELDPAFAETCWCVYAWPAEGKGRTFFTNQEGDILATTGYAGDREPLPYAAFENASGLAAATVIVLPEDRRIGADRQEWKPTG